MITNNQDTAQLSILIEELHLRNFKGIERFDLDTAAEDVAIRGDNATGKTTLADAVSWLLFGKDSSGRADFEIKTLTENGEPIHNLEHEVEAEFLVNARRLTLKKVYAEKWTRKRGEASPTFTGHETTCYVDEVPVKKSEYDARVAEIAPEEVFRILTDPYHFASRMHWQDRRQILLEVCGDVTDEEVIASDPALADLPSILEGRSLEDARKVIHARRKKINDELKTIPVRIDEAQRSVTTLPPGQPDKATAENDLEKLRTMRKDAEQEKSRIESGGEIAEKRKKLAEAEAAAAEARRQIAEGADKKRATLRLERSRLRDELDGLQSAVITQESVIKRSREAIEQIDKERDETREEWKQVNARVFEYEATDTCPACGQALPKDQVEEARKKAEEEFNARKARDLGQLDERGKKLKRDVEKLERQIETAQEIIDDLKPKAEAAEKQISDLSDKIERVLDPSDHSLYEHALNVVEAIKEKIASLESGNAEALAEVQEKIYKLDDDIRTQEDYLATLRASEAAKERIEELGNEERRLAGQYEELERQLYLLDSFLRAKVDLLTDRINSRFETVRFRLFEEQINQGLREVCEVSVGGVPWSDLNHGAQINAGLEIIDVLGEHYGLRAPILIDQAESVTQIRPTEAQQIRLIVDSRYPELHIETRELETEEV